MGWAAFFLPLAAPGSARLATPDTGAAKRPLILKVTYS